MPSAPKLPPPPPTAKASGARPVVKPPPSPARAATSHEPPALPFPLSRSRALSDEDWLRTLPAPARAVLEAARQQKPGWPHAPRVLGAVATPVSAKTSR